MRNFIKKTLRNTFRFFKWQKYIVSNYKSRTPVKLPSNNQGIKVHIRPGEIDLKGWINIDGRDFDHVHIVTDDLSLNEFKNEQLVEIYMCHILEHLSFSEVVDAINIFHKKLKVGGIIRISVPDFNVISKIYSSSGEIELIKYPLMGGQDYSYNFHKSIFDENSLTKLLKESGFDEIKTWDPIQDFGVEIGDWSSGVIKTPEGNKTISLNLKAVRI